MELGCPLKWSLSIVPPEQNVCITGMIPADGSGMAGSNSDTKSDQLHSVKCVMFLKTYRGVSSSLYMYTMLYTVFHNNIKTCISLQKDT